MLIFLETVIQNKSLFLCFTINEPQHFLNVAFVLHLSSFNVRFKRDKVSGALILKIVVVTPPGSVPWSVHLLGSFQ